MDRGDGAVTAGSIRWRILKALDAGKDVGAINRYSGFDPMEDTERPTARTATTTPSTVTAGSIRWRILKVRRMLCQGDLGERYSGFDPMEDTESLVAINLHRVGCQLQRVRSDGGY